MNMQIIKLSTNHKGSNESIDRNIEALEQLGAGDGHDLDKTLSCLIDTARQEKNVEQLCRLGVLTEVRLTSLLVY